MWPKCSKIGRVLYAYIKEEDAKRFQKRRERTKTAEKKVGRNREKNLDFTEKWDIVALDSNEKVNARTKPISHRPAVRRAVARYKKGGNLMQYGHFDDAAREYVITEPQTPSPWINYLGSEAFLP